MKDWIKLNVIASFDNHEQDIFDMSVSPKENATEEDLLNSIMSNLEHPKLLNFRKRRDGIVFSSRSFSASTNPSSYENLIFLS